MVTLFFHISNKKKEVPQTFCVSNNNKSVLTMVCAKYHENTICDLLFLLSHVENNKYVQVKPVITGYKLDIFLYIFNLVRTLLQVDEIKNSEAALNSDLYSSGPADNTRGYSSVPMNLQYLYYSNSTWPLILFFLVHHRLLLFPGPKTPIACDWVSIPRIKVLNFCTVITIAIHIYRSLKLSLHTLCIS